MVLQRRWPPESTPERIHHLNARNPAIVAELFREENGATATNSRLGDQRIEPAELFTERELVGIKNEGGDQS